MRPPYGGERKFVRGTWVTPIFDKKLSKIFFSRTRGRIALNLEDAGPSHFFSFSNYDPWLILTYFTPRSNWVASAFVWEKVKNFDIETIATFDLKVGRCIEQNK